MTKVLARVRLRSHDLGALRGVPGCVGAAPLGASESAAALSASESAAGLGASASTAIGPASAEALHTFTLDSGASRCFFRDCTIVTLLAAPVPISLADPTGGPVIAQASTVLPCQVAALSQVSASGQFAASCSCQVLTHQNSSLAPPTRSPLSAAPPQHALPSPFLWPSQVPAPPLALACPAVPSLR
ncbi:unnamed protein product [Closterium sp. NIES-53]